MLPSNDCAIDFKACKADHMLIQFVYKVATIGICHSYQWL